MKSLVKTAKQTPGATLLTIVAVVTGLSTMVVDSSEILGISTEVVKWVSFGAAALTFVVNTVVNNQE